jgi:hypothetical protein
VSIRCRCTSISVMSADVFRVSGGEERAPVSAECRTGASFPRGVIFKGRVLCDGSGARSKSPVARTESDVSSSSKRSGQLFELEVPRTGDGFSWTAPRQVARAQVLSTTSVCPSATAGPLLCRSATRCETRGQTRCVGVPRWSLAAVWRRRPQQIVAKREDGQVGSGSVPARRRPGRPPARKPGRPRSLF